MPPEARRGIGYFPARVANLVIRQQSHLGQMDVLLDVAVDIRHPFNVCLKKRHQLLCRCFPFPEKHWS